MNQRWTVRNRFGETVYCVLAGDAPVGPQLAAVLSLRKGEGFSAAVQGDAILVQDYFSGETAGRFEILSVADTDEPVALCWQTGV